MIAEYRAIFPIIDRDASVASLKREARALAWQELGRLGFTATGKPSTVTIDHENARLLISIEVQAHITPFKQVAA